MSGWPQAYARRAAEEMVSRLTQELRAGQGNPGEAAVSRVNARVRQDVLEEQTGTATARTVQVYI